MYSILLTSTGHRIYLKTGKTKVKFIKRRDILLMHDRQRIMVIDDDQNMLKLLDRTLEMEGYDTVVFADGSSALNLLSEVNPDLVILDIMMPGLDGLQTLDLIREHSNVPVIMLTARHEIEILQKALFMGADDYVNKPFNTRSLVARIQAKLRRTHKESK
jgi:DNA-binding response OmpR family regulator